MYDHDETFNCWFNNVFTVTNGHIITHLGVYSESAGDAGMFLLNDSKVMVAKVLAPHTGSGWEWFALDAPVTVTASGWKVGLGLRSGTHFRCRSNVTLYNWRYQVSGSAQTFDNFDIGEAFGTEGDAGYPAAVGYGYQ